jgi:fructose-bisphosphate aldolase class 1
MIPYKDLNHDSNVRSYGIGDNYIILEFKNGDFYKYACPPASRENLETAKELAKLGENDKVMFKLTLPTKSNLYKEVTEEAHTVRVVALSGGYTRKDACDMLAQNEGVIASFSRAFTEGLSVNQTPEEFDNTLATSIKEIADASNA